MPTELLPWFKFTHGRHSPLLCHHEVLFSTQGTQQGDHLEPAFFSLAIHAVVTQIRGTPGMVWLIFYLDDDVLVGDPETLLDLLHKQKLSTEFSPIGLKVNHSKCKFWNPESPVPVIDWSTLLPNYKACTPLARLSVLHQVARLRSKKPT